MAIGVGLTGPRGGSGGGGGTCTSRAWVRNPDWLDLPSTSDGDDVIYILSQVYGDDRPNFMSVYATVSSGNYTVDLYNDGTTVTNHSSAAQADFDLDYSKGTGEVSEFGYKQVITKITPETGTLTGFDMYRTHADANGGFLQPTLSVKITSQTITSLNNCFRGTTSKSFHKSLEEFEWVGTCNVTTATYAFYNCDEFCKIKGNFEDITNWQQMFGLAGDIDISELQTPTSGITTSTQALKSSRIRTITGTAAENLFKGVKYPLSILESCSSLITVGTSANPTRWDSIDNASGFSQAFQSCTNLKQAYFREASTAPLSIYRMFRNDYVLGRVETIDGSGVTNTTGAFQDCRSLEWLRITGLTVSFDLTNCNMSREALVQVFNDLGTASATITITNNPGVGDLTAADLLIATNKGWTVTT